MNFNDIGSKFLTFMAAIAVLATAAAFFRLNFKKSSMEVLRSDRDDANKRAESAVFDIKQQEIRHEQEASALKTELSQKGTEIAQLTTALSQKDQEITTLRNVVTGQDQLNRIEELLRSLVESNST